MFLCAILIDEVSVLAYIFHIKVAFTGISRHLELDINSFFLYIRDKKRKAPRRTVQLLGRSLVIGQFRLYWCKVMPNTAAFHTFVIRCQKRVKENR